MAPIAPKFRRESWYGRLYLRAYGADRGWLIGLRRMIFALFRYAPYPTFPEGASEADILGTIVDWRRRREEARDRAIAFLMAPPPVQPFVEDGARVSICPTFWKIVFALFVYCPIAAIRTVGHAIATTLRAAGSAIASAFRWTGRRFGRPLAWASAGTTVLAIYGAFTYLLAVISYDATGYLMGRSGISTEEARQAAYAAKVEAEREQLRQDYLESCASRIREHVEYAKERTWQPDLECPPDYGRLLSHEEYARQCVGHDELRLEVIERLESGNFTCATGGWNDMDLKNLFPAKADRNALAAWLGKELRKVFADELKVEIASRERRLAEARKRDAEVVGAVTVSLLPMQRDPAALYRRFTEFCRYNEYAKEWEMARGSGDEMTNATCATLAGLFEDSIADAQSAIRWQRLKQSARAGAPYTAKIVGLTLGGSLLLLLLVFVLERYGQPLLRGLEWFFERMLAPGFTWLVIIVFAPIWAPARYLVWPALKAVGRAWMLVWNSGLVAGLRAAVAAALTAVATAIRRFVAAVRQILADTRHLIRAFASAKWERLCPFIEWQ